jgi:hypothetical protein
MRVTVMRVISMLMLIIALISQGAVTPAFAMPAKTPREMAMAMSSTVSHQCDLQMAEHVPAAMKECCQDHSTAHHAPMQHCGDHSSDMSCDNDCSDCQTHCGSAAAFPLFGKAFSDQGAESATASMPFFYSLSHTGETPPPTA